MPAEPEPAPLRTRTVLYMDIGGYADTSIQIDHVYAPEGATGTCANETCGNAAHDPGLIGLAISDDSDTEITLLMDPGEALVLAERLQRAVALVFEADEELPDIEREAARYAPRTETP